MPGTELSSLHVLSLSRARLSGLCLPIFQRRDLCQAEKSEAICLRSEFTRSPETPNQAVPWIPQWISVFRGHLALLGWYPHLAHAASGLDSDLVVSARGELVVPETVRLPCICAVIRWCPDHQYRGALLPTTQPRTSPHGLITRHTSTLAGRRVLSTPCPGPGCPWEVLPLVPQIKITQPHAQPPAPRECPSQSHPDPQSSALPG